MLHAPLIEGVGIGISVEGERGLNAEVHDHQALGAEPVRENLDGVADKQTGPGERVEDLEDPDEEDHGLVGALGLVLAIETRAKSPEDKGAAHATGGSEESSATANSVDEHGHGQGNDEGHTRLTGGETELGGGALNAGGVVELGRVVGDNGVAGPLGEEAERNQNSEAVTVALGLEKVHVGAVLGRLVLQAEGLLDLLELELNGRVVGIAVGVVLGEDVEGLVVLVLGDQETGGLGNPPDTEELDDRGETLEQGGNTPGPVAVDVVGAKGQPRDDEGTDVPQAVVDGGELGAMLRVSELGKKHRGGDLGEGVAKAEHDTATHESVEVVSTSLKTGTTDHDDAANNDGELTAIVIGENGAE